MDLFAHIRDVRARYRKEKDLKTDLMEELKKTLTT